MNGSFLQLAKFLKPYQWLLSEQWKRCVHKIEVCVEIVSMGQRVKGQSMPESALYAPLEC